MRSVRLIRGRSKLSKIIKEFKNSKEMEELRRVFDINKDIKLLYLAEDSYIDTMVSAAILRRGKLEKLGGENNGKEDTEA